MKLSLMLLNMTFPICMNSDYTPKAEGNIDEFEAILKMARDAGYEAVDLSMMELRMFGAKKVKALLEQYGLTCASVMCFETLACTEEEEQEELALRIQEVIGQTLDVDCKLLMLMVTDVSAQMSRMNVQIGTVQNLHQAILMAKDQGVTILVEDFPSTHIPMCSIKEMEFLLNALPDLRLIYDNANMMIAGNDPEEFFNYFKRYISHVHLKDVVLCPPDTEGGDVLYDGRKMCTELHGEGSVDFKKVIGWLKDTGYEGYLSVEYAPPARKASAVEENIKNARLYLEQFL